MRIQGKCVEILSCTEYEHEVQSLRYKLLPASVPGEGTDFCLLEVIITVHFTATRNLVILTKSVRSVEG